MMATDEAALECDLAETYHIYDYRAFTPKRVALFSIGLRNNSRIKMKLNGLDYPFETMLIACAVDRLGLLLWAKTEDAKKGRNKPKSIVGKMVNQTKEKDFIVFDSPEEFEQAMKEINMKGG